MNRINMDPIPGPFITVVSVDDGPQLDSNLTVMDAPDSLLMPASRLSVVHEEAEEILYEMDTLDSGNFEAGSEAGGGSAYVTVLALGKKLQGQKRSVVNICGEDDQSAPHVVAILSKADNNKLPASALKKTKTSSFVEICNNEPIDDFASSPHPSSADTTEEVIVYKLPGERLGFGLRFDGGVSHPGEKVKGLFIQSCADDSPAARSKASWGNLVEGDEIVAIENMPVSEMSKMNCIQLLKDASVVVHLLIRHFYSSRTLLNDASIEEPSPVPHTKRPSYAWISDDITDLNVSYQYSAEEAEELQACNQSSEDMACSSSEDGQEEEEEDFKLCHDRIQINNLNNNVHNSTLKSHTSSPINPSMKEGEEQGEEQVLGEGTLGIGIGMSDSRTAFAVSKNADLIIHHSEEKEEEQLAKPVQPERQHSTKIALRHPVGNNPGLGSTDFANESPEENMEKRYPPTPAPRNNNKPLATSETGQAVVAIQNPAPSIPVAPPRKLKAESPTCQRNRQNESLSAVKIRPPMGFTDEEISSLNSSNSSFTFASMDSASSCLPPQEAKMYTNALDNSALSDKNSSTGGNQQRDSGNSNHNRAESVISGCESDETGSTRSTVVSRLSMLSITNFSESCVKRIEVAGPNGQYPEGIEDITSPLFTTEDPCEEEEIPLAPPPYFQDMNNNNGGGGGHLGLTNLNQQGNKSFFSNTTQQHHHNRASSYEQQGSQSAGPEFNPSTYQHYNQAHHQYQEYILPAQNEMTLSSSKGEHCVITRSKENPNSNPATIRLDITDDDELALLAEELGLGDDEEEDEAEELRKFLLLEEKLKNIHDKGELGDKKPDHLHIVHPPTSTPSLANPQRMGGSEQSGGMHSHNGNYTQRNANNRSTFTNDSRIPVYCNGEKERRHNGNSGGKSSQLPQLQGGGGSEGKKANALNGFPLMRTMSAPLPTKSNESTSTVEKGDVKVKARKNVAELNEERGIITNDGNVSIRKAVSQSRSLNLEQKSTSQTYPLEDVLITCCKGTSSHLIPQENPLNPVDLANDTCPRGNPVVHEQALGALDLWKQGEQSARTQDIFFRAETNKERSEQESSVQQQIRTSSDEELNNQLDKDNSLNSQALPFLDKGLTYSSWTDGGADSSASTRDNKNLGEDNVNDASFGNSSHTTRQEQQNSSCQRIEVEEQGTRIQGSDTEPKGMDSSHELYNHHSFVPPTFSRLPPDGDEFPNSWADEESNGIIGCDPKKFYRSDMKMIGGNLPPPPPIPSSEPPAEDELPPPLPSTVPPVLMPKAPLTRRSSSVEDRKRLFAQQQQQQQLNGTSGGSFKLPSPLPRGHEPSKKSVKDKIAMFSSRSSSTEETPVPPPAVPATSLGYMNGSFRSSTSSLPRSGAGVGSFSKSSENLLNGGSMSLVDGPGIHKPVHGMDKWKITQSTFDLRKNSIDSTSGSYTNKATFNLNATPEPVTAAAVIMTSTPTRFSCERSQSMLNVGQDPSSSYQRLSSSALRYNNTNSNMNGNSGFNRNLSGSKIDSFGSSATLMEHRRRTNLSKLRGLVIPDKHNTASSSVSVVDLPTIISKDAVLTTTSSSLSKPGSDYQHKTTTPSSAPPRPDTFDSSYKKTGTGEKQLFSAKTASLPLHSGQFTSGGDSDSDWKLPTCALPKYSPAFKRRSLTPYQSPLTSSKVSSSSSTVTSNSSHKTPPVAFNNGPTNYKLTPEPKSLESLTSPHSDSSFEFSSSNSPHGDAISKKSNNHSSNHSHSQHSVPNNPISQQQPPLLPGSIAPSSGASMNRRNSFGKPNGNCLETATEILVTNQPSVDKSSRLPPSPPTHNKADPSQNKYNGKGKLEDSDNDSAVSSSRSSISHGLSPPNSPTPEESSSTTPDPERNPQDSSNDNEREAEGDDSTNSDEGWRILKPQSVEAINRKNVLTSAKFSSGGGLDGRRPSGTGEENNHHKNHRRSDDEEAGYADAEAEDTESSCSELDVSSSRRRSSVTNRLVQLRRGSAPNADTEEEEDTPPPRSTPSHSASSSIDVNDMILPELTESPLQAIFDMEVQMAYINEICDALPARSENSRYFSRRDSEATVIERPVIKERKGSRDVIDNIAAENIVHVHSALIVPSGVSSSAADRRARNRSSSGNESDFSSSVSVSSQSQSQHSSYMEPQQKSSAYTSPLHLTSTSSATKSKDSLPEDKWTMLEKKYSKSLTSVNLLGTSSSTTATKLSAVEHPISSSSSTTVSPSTVSKFSTSNVGIEKAFDKMLLEKTMADSNKNKTLSASIPRGRNDFKSLSEKWQQISTDGTSTSAAAPVAISSPIAVKPSTLSSPKPLPASFTKSLAVAEKPAAVTSATPSSYRSPLTPKKEVTEYTHRKTSTPLSSAASPITPDLPGTTPPAVSSYTNNSSSAAALSDQQLSSEKPIQTPEESQPPRPARLSKTESNSATSSSPAVPSEMHMPSMGSTKRSVSVNDIRKAFEKAEIAVNSYGRDDNSGIKNSKQDPNGLSLPSAHFRVSSFDSTTSEDSSATTPASGIYGSVNSLVSSAPRDPYGSITSLASSTSLISPQELQQLIDEANQSLEEAGTPSHEVCVIILHREYVGGSLGITLAGGADYETKEITVHKVLTGSIADRDGRVHRGDRVLSINGKSTKGLTHREALTLLKAPRTEVVLVVSRGRNGTNGFQTIEESSVTTGRSTEPIGTSSILEADEEGTFKWGSMKSVMLIKDGAGLGFSLEGGKGSIHGDKPLTVKKIFVGGPAEKCGELNVGDLIVSINSVNMSSKSRTEAWNFMKKLGDGEVKICVRSPTS